MAVSTFTSVMKSEVVIGKYIRQLLSEGKRVILPGFGNLQMKEVPGEVPPSGGKIRPPGPSVRFDEKYSKDDGLLASTCSAGENMDPGEAEQQVLELVDAIRFALDKGENYLLPDTGTFSRDDEGKVHFHTDPAWILEPDQYGLEPMDLLELDESAAFQAETAGGELADEAASDKASAEEPAGEGPAGKDHAGEPFAGETDAEEPVRTTRTAEHFTPSWMTPEPREKTKRRRPAWRAIWIITASLILILLALIFIPLNRSKEGGIQFGREGIILKKKSTRPEAPVVSQPEVSQPEEQANAPAGDEGGTVAGQENAGTQSEEVTPDPGEQVSRDRYFIIAGSFRYLRNASELQDQLRAQGYRAEVMITDDRMYRVSVASYATQQEALRRLEGFKAEPGLQNCWLLAR